MAIVDIKTRAIAEAIRNLDSIIIHRGAMADVVEYGWKGRQPHQCYTLGGEDDYSTA